MIARLISFLRHRLGMDRAIAATTITQLMRFVTGPVTMFLLIRYLTPEEQGFFYSFAGAVGIQVFLEAGFAQSITQFSSKEFASLRFNRQGLLTGSPAALSRLRSIFHKANRYYSIMAAVLGVALATGGYFFFSSKADHGVQWMIPWFVISFCAALGFLLTPFWALLEGCNRIAEVATYRLWFTLAGFFVTAIGLLTGLGIKVSALVAATSLIFPIGYLFLRWRPLVFQILRPPGAEQVSWGKEIWGFQSRIAGTWMSRYFLESGIAPLAFQLSGPIIAGQTGMTFQIIRLIGGIANSWTAIRIPTWGILAAKGKWEEIDRSWAIAARRNISICVLGLLLFLLCLPVLGWLWPAAYHRFLPPAQVAGFAIGWMLYSIWLVSMHYTRALRKEPYTFLHLAVGLVFVSGCFMVNNLWAPATIPIMFALVHLPAAFIAVHLRSKIRASVANI